MPLRSRAELYLHFVWATEGREPLLTPDIERAVHRCIVNEVEKLKGVVLAIGGMPDHVHLVVQFPKIRSTAEVMKQAKGVSSALANDLTHHTRLFRWQNGYAVFSVCRSHLPTVIAYVKNQKRHHTQGPLDADAEEIDEEV